MHPFSTCESRKSALGTNGLNNSEEETARNNISNTLQNNVSILFLFILLPELLVAEEAVIPIRFMTWYDTCTYLDLLMILDLFKGTYWDFR